MILIDSLIVGKELSGIGVYTVNLVKHLSKYLDFEILTSVPEIFKGNYKFKVAPKIVSKNNNKLKSLLRFLYIQTLRGKGILYKTYYEPSIFWKGPQILTIHDIIPVLYKNYYFDKFLIYEFTKLLIHKIDFIFTVSQRSKEDIVNFFNINEEKVKIFYMSYDEEFFKKDIDENEVLEFKKKNNLTNYFLVVGAQFPHKNVEVLIKLMKILNDDFKLVIIGTKKPYENKIKKLINNLNINNKIRILNYISALELKRYYLGSLALLFPSRYEGFGIPVLEAFSLGIPVIGTMAINEVGANAIEYADFDDVHSWKIAIERVLSNRDYYVNKGFERLKNFSWNKTAKEISLFFKNQFGC